MNNIRDLPRDRSGILSHREFKVLKAGETVLGERHFSIESLATMHPR